MDASPYFLLTTFGSGLEPEHQHPEVDNFWCTSLDARNFVTDQFFFLTAITFCFLPWSLNYPQRLKIFCASRGEAGELDWLGIVCRIRAVQS
jgi:hypothetical protein